MKRIFIAIKIYPDSGFKNFISEIKTELNDERIRWVDLQNLHLTLRFLGETRNDLISVISEELTRVALDRKTFTLNLKGLGVFRSVSYPRVIWVGVEKNEALEQLKMKVDERLHDLGFEKERKTYFPHLTLGRMKRIDDRAKLRDLIQQTEGKNILVQDAESIVLYESRLKEKGPEYIPIKEYFFL